MIVSTLEPVVLFKGEEYREACEKDGSVSMCHIRDSVSQIKTLLCVPGCSQFQQCAQRLVALLDYCCFYICC